jgi:hypothetical protein
MTGPQQSWPRQGPPLPGALLPPRPVSGQAWGNPPVPPGRIDEDGQRGYPAPWSGNRPPPSYLSGPPSYLSGPPSYLSGPPGYPSPAGYGQSQQAPPGYRPGGASGVAQEPDIADWWQRLVARLVDGFGFVIVQQILSTVFYALFGRRSGSTRPASG